MPTTLDSTSKVKIPLSVIVTIVISTFLAIFAWLWFLHQRTDEIPVIKKDIEIIRDNLGDAKASLLRLERWAGTKPDAVATLPIDHSNATIR